MKYHITSLGMIKTKGFRQDGYAMFLYPQRLREHLSGMLNQYNENTISSLRQKILRKNTHPYKMPTHERYHLRINI